jgi:chloramphenicol-sensitive protein RarD
LRERLRLFQWMSIGLAVIGVAYLAFRYGRLPWIAIGLAITFGLYGFVKKLSPLRTVYGLTLESGILLLPGILYLFYQDWIGRGAFLHMGFQHDILMVCAGLITTIPLLLFTSAARRIPLTTMGVMHYITPTCQFLLGLLVYKEAFDRGQAFGFGMVWIGLAIYCAEGLTANRTAVDEAQGLKISP